MKWLEIKQSALEAFKNRNLSHEHLERLKFEFKEIEKQGAENYWETTLIEGKKFEHNKYGLVLPFLLGVTSEDPIASGVKHIVEYQADFPDIDIDFLPITRDLIKEHAAEVYGADKVCSVGTWQTYKPKLAIQDSARALGVGVNEARELTKHLPDEFDELDKAAAFKDYEIFREFYKDYKDIVDLAYRMRDRIKTQGKHAGGLIISSVPVKNFIPLTMPSPADRKQGRWSSAWTEGRNLQLSKFGFVKFDFLGLRTLSWCWDAKNRIKKNQNITIDWSDMDPEEDRAGHIIFPDGDKKPISFSDEESLAIANDGKMETVFQFETDLATSIVSKGGVHSFNDLLIYTSLGRPGPLPMVDVYIERRDGKSNWRREQIEQITEMLEDTYGIIVFQEQLAKMWRVFAGFTAPEAESARKAVAKKWEDKLVHIEKRWIEGATRTIGFKEAREWWDKMVTFGRYAFNKSHATAYSIITYRCLWLKAHFLEEWWAAVLSDPPHRDKLIRWMGVARQEGVDFGLLDVNVLSLDFIVKDNKILPGLSMIKGIGAKTVKEMNLQERDFKTIDDYVEVYGSSKTILERLIKLGAFNKIHMNKRALWAYWMFKYGSDKESKEIKRLIKWSLRWDPKDIEVQRKKQRDDYFGNFPNRKKVPATINNWVPRTPNRGKVKLEDVAPAFRDPQYKLCSKIEVTLEEIERLFDGDFSLKEILRFEKEYLGFFWHSPMDVFQHRGITIQDAKTGGMLECVIESVAFNKGSESEYVTLNVTDGIEQARVMVWGNEVAINSDEVMRPNIGVKMKVKWNDKFRSFNLMRGKQIIPLRANKHAP